MTMTGRQDNMGKTSICIHTNQGLKMAKDKTPVSASTEYYFYNMPKLKDICVAELFDDLSIVLKLTDGSFVEYE